MRKIWYTWDIYVYRTAQQSVKEKDKKWKRKSNNKMLNILNLHMK